MLQTHNLYQHKKNLKMLVLFLCLNILTTYFVCMILSFFKWHLSGRIGFLRVLFSIYKRCRSLHSSLTFWIIRIIRYRKFLALYAEVRETSLSWSSTINYSLFVVNVNSHSLFYMGLQAFNGLSNENKEKTDVSRFVSDMWNRIAWLEAEEGQDVYRLGCVEFWC